MSQRDQLRGDGHANGFPAMRVGAADSPSCIPAGEHRVPDGRRGRLADCHVSSGLARTQASASVHEHDGLLVITANPHGLFRPTKQGYLGPCRQALAATDGSCSDRDSW